MRNLRLDICYDGTRYRGFQRLANTENTIQGKLERALSRILDEEIQISGSGRTDAGVHAMGQVINFHCSSSMPCQQIHTELRRYLPEDIGVYFVKDVSARFHARLNAKEKTYRYRLWNTLVPCVFDRRFVAVLPGALDIDAMKSAAKILEGTHDFSAFCSNKHFKKSTVRAIRSIQILRQDNELQFLVTGNGFLHGMVRILVGTLVEVGQGKRTAESMESLFGADRSEAGPLMPPEGLCLMEVMY